jgi:Spy/CpxP family protein refolding chaperone
VPSNCGRQRESGLSAAMVGTPRFLSHLTKLCNRTAARTVISFKGAKSALQPEMKPTMKRNLLAVATAGAIALGGFVVVQAQPGSGAAGAGHWHGHSFGLKGITEKLNLTADQQTKVQPILDAAKPQIAAIHQEAMQKMQTVMSSTMSQIRPLLNADQQTKLDAIQKAHQDMLNARKQLHDAMQN